MKKYISILFLFVSLSLSGTNYYVKVGGSDVAAGTSDANAWATITKVNATSFVAGDSILFKRGDIFVGTITPTTSGTGVATTITFAAYGTGAKPIITGFTTITGWTNDGGGIYSKVISTASTPNVLNFNGTNQPYGRFPNSTYLSADATSGYTSLTDAATPSATTNWTGAKVVIRKVNWIWDRCTVTAHSGNVITYTSPNTVSATAGFGFFFQQDIRTLDALGEWCYLGGKLSMYFGGDNPNIHSVKIPTINRLIYINGKSYITIHNLDLQGANTDAVYSSGTYTTVKNCTISYVGDNGVNGTSTYLTVSTNNIYNCQNRGIYCIAANPTFANNYVHGIGMIPGMGGDGSTTYTGICTVQSLAPDAVMEYNRVDSTGYSGLAFSGSRSIIRYNYITNYCYKLDDGSGIYTAGNNQTGRKIYNNIVINNSGTTASLGTAGSTVSITGIYLDNNSTDIQVYNNTSSSNVQGYLLHNSHQIEFHDNISFDNKYGIYIARSSGMDAMVNNNLSRNQVLAKLSTQYPLFHETSDNTVTSLGNIDSNYYMRPPAPTTNIVITVLVNATTYRTLSSWQTYSTKDSHTTIAPYATLDVQFYYNETNANKVITLDGRFFNVKGTTYLNTITLPAYTSTLLFRDETYVVTPEILSTVIFDSYSALSSRTIKVSGTVTFDGGGTVSERGVVYSYTTNPTTSNYKAIAGSGLGSYMVSITGLIPASKIYFRAYSINQAGTSYSGRVYEIQTSYSSQLNSNGKTIRYKGKIIKH